ncbi:MAG: hypothetical protein ABIT37_20820 [Luteolibacter sp.]
MRPLHTLTVAFLCHAIGFAADYDNKSTEAGGAKDAAAQATVPSPNGISEVVIVYKTHFDIGYTARASDVIHDYRTEMADRLLEAIEANKPQPKEKQFVWTLSGYPMKQILWEGQTPERRSAIEQGIRDGNIVTHAYPFTTHTEIAEPEDLVRGLNISSTLARRYGQPLSRAAKMSDVPGQSWIFPTLMTQAGIRFYHMGGPLVNKSFDLPPMFWWEGPDGSRLLTLYNNNYGSSPLPPKDWPYKSWVYISMTGDNQGPPPLDIVARDLAFYQGKGIHAKVGRLDDFADLVLKEDLSKLTVVRSDIPDPWVHGPMSMPAAAKLARNSRLNIGALDALTTLERCWKIHRPDLRASIAEAYEQSALYAEHTWGLANQHYVKLPWGKDWDKLWEEGLPANFRMMEQSWKDHAGYVETVDRLTSAPYQEAVTTLADQVNVSGPRIVVYNPLPWKRDGEVTINAFHFPTGSALKPVDGGDAVPFAVEGPGIETPDRVRRFIVKDIPPLGYRTFIVTMDSPALPELRADESAGIIESPYFKATLDPKRGRIASLIDKRSGRELVDPTAPQGFGQYFYERFSWQNLEDWLNASLYPRYKAHRFAFTAYDMPRDVPYASALPEDMTLSIKQTALDVSAVMTGTIAGPGKPQRVSIRLTLPGATPYADLTVGWQKQPNTLPEAGWICLPFKVDQPKFRLGKLGADLDPAKDITISEANHHNSWVNTGVTIHDGNTGAGIGLCPIDSPMVSLGMPGEYKFESRYTPEKSWVYLNLYNNHWRTNFAAWVGDGSPMNSKVRLWSFDKYATESALFSPAMEARVPLAAGRSVGHPGKLPPSQTGIGLSRKGIMLTAFGPNPDGDGTVVRVWEQAGNAGDLTVTLPAGFKTATPVNLRGEPAGEPLPINDTKLTFALKAYAPASFVLH